MNESNQLSNRPEPLDELNNEVRDRLRRLSPADPPPNRTTLLNCVYQAADAEEHKMSMLKQLFSGQRWYLKTALVVFALAAITALTFIVPSLDNIGEGGNLPSWATTNGYQVVYELGAVTTLTVDADAGGTVDIPLLEDLKEGVKAWREARKPAATKQKHMLRLEATEAGVTVAVGLPGEELAVAEDMAKALAEIPGLPEPTISEMTWFHDAEKGICDGGLTITINDHQFTFPPGVSPEEMEDEIKAWLIANGADADVSVKVQKFESGDGAEKRIMIGIGCECEDCDDLTCQGCE